MNAAARPSSGWRGGLHSFTCLEPSRRLRQRKVMLLTRRRGPPIAGPLRIVHVFFISNWSCFMRTNLTLALLACAALAASSSLFAQSEKKDASAKTEQKKGGLAGQDRKYFQEIAQANLAEIETGKLAQKKASSEEVKKFAQHMVADHGKMLQEQQTLAKSKGVSMPKQPKREHQAALKKLEGASGEQFDRAYMDQMVKDHEKTLKLVQETAKKAKDPDLKQAAEKAVPEVQKHLDMAKQIAEKKSK
jgi:predicted outer membrane protein